MVSPKEWDVALAGGDFTGETELHAADGTSVAVQWGAHPEVVTGSRLVLFVALNTSRWGGRVRRAAPPDPEPAALSDRERLHPQLSKIAQLRYRRAPIRQPACRAMPPLVANPAMDVGTEVVVETAFGTYRGLLAQGYVRGAHVRLRCLGHDIWLHNRSVYAVRAAEVV